MQQVDWKSADEVAEDILKGEATYQLIVDLWSRMGELEDKVVELQARLQARREPTEVGSVRGALYNAKLKIYERISQCYKEVC